VARRAPDRRLFPGLYEGCGGQLRLSETFAEGVARHFRLEMGIEVRVLEDYHCLYAIREPDQPTIPGLRFLCEPAGPAEPRSPNHSDVRWLPEAEFRDIPDEQFIGGLKAEVVGLLDRYKADHRGRRAER
jgi:ADP-ribose pyrophosphatase YjhB (NUDIX family)